MVKELEREKQEKYKEIEKKYPELLKIKDEAIRIESDTFNKMGSEAAEKFKKFEKEITDTEGFKDAMEVLRNFIKDVGVMKSFKMLKGFLSLISKLSDCEKRATKILQKGDIYVMPVLGVIKGGESNTESDDIIKKIKDAISVKNLMKVLTGKADDLEVEYMKKDGGESSGELKEVEIKDDGSIQVTINNDAVGDIKKDITEITTDEGSEDVNKDVANKVGELIKSNPEMIKSISKFINFISDEKNKDKFKDIEEVMKREI